MYGNNKLVLELIVVVKVGVGYIVVDLMIEIECFDVIVGEVGIV